jgi:hypothetical protein
MRGKQRGEVGEGRLDVAGGGVVMAFDDDERVDRGHAGGALGALAPAPASSAHDVVAVDEDHLARVGGNAAGRSKVGEQLSTGGETDSDGAGDVGQVEHGDRNGVADRDEVPMSTRVLMVGMSPCLASRRSSASAALRCWVGLAPNRAKARRHATIEGSSAIAIMCSLSEAACCAARYSSSSSGDLARLASLVAWMTPARIVGYRLATASS